MTDFWGWRVDLSRLNGKRIAILFLQRDGSSFVLRGTGSYEVDETQGNFLRVPVQEGGNPAEGDPHVIFYERSGDFTFVDDDRHGCDYSVTVKDSTPPEKGRGRKKRKK